VPTCLSVSSGGNIVAVGFTEDAIKVYDMRQGSSRQTDDWYFELEGHNDMVKAIKLSSDGMVCLSTSTDGTLRVWDLNLKKCITVFGDEKNKKNSVNFHKDSIWCMETS
jgi:WD40 repeat protein